MTYYGAKELADSLRTVRKNTLIIAEDIPEDRYSFRAAPETRNTGLPVVHEAPESDLWGLFAVCERTGNERARVTAPSESDLRISPLPKA